jgi:uncharacterized RDD family membrane protein YckC
VEELDDLGITEDLVTGEAVVLDLRPASFLTRTMAIILDAVILIAIYVGVSIGLSVVVSGADEAAAAAITLVSSLGVFLGVPAAVETFTRGRSIGKLAAGLRVVRDDGGPIRARHAVIRALLGVLELWLAFGSIALIASLANRRGKRLGDMLAGTFVVRERTPSAAVTVAVMPPRLAAWAAGSDLGRVPDRLALAARQFLSRATRLHPGSRQRLGLSIAHELASYVAPAPPPGTHPEEFIAAVLAERRRRDLDRLQAEARARVEREVRRRAASPLSAVGSSLVGDE